MGYTYMVVIGNPFSFLEIQKYFFFYYLDMNDIYKTTVMSAKCVNTYVYTACIFNLRFQIVTLLFE